VETFCKEIHHSLLTKFYGLFFHLTGKFSRYTLFFESLFGGIKDGFDEFKELLRINVVVELKLLVVLKYLTVNLGRGNLFNTCLVVN